MMKKIVLPLIGGLSLALPATAHAAAEDSQLWLQAGVSVDLGGNWKLSEEIVTRFSDGKNGLYEVENNLLLGYKLDDTVTLWAGYTHDPNYVAGHFIAMEHRAREQVTFDKVAKIAGGALSFRLRSEQRWRDGTDGTGWRLRPYAKWQLPLSKSGKTALVLSHESFVNLNSTAFQRQTGYDRMRNALAVKFPLGGKLSAEAGYLNQYASVRGGQDRMDHAATVSLSLSL